MTKSRLEAFSDGVIAIIITIMVLELRPPDDASLDKLLALVPVFISYLLSFIFLGIYWSNHHHLLQAIQRVDGRVLWANLHLLFWLSLVPFTTVWIGKSHFASLAIASYGVVLLLASVAFSILVRSLIHLHGIDSELAKALGRDIKGKISVGLNFAGIPLAFVAPWIAGALYVAVAVIWLVPDRRIESRVGRGEQRV